MPRMPRGPLIPDEVRILAAQLYKEHPKWTNAMIRDEIRAIVHEKPTSVPRSWPSKYAIDRIMPEIRRNHESRMYNPKPRDGLWTVYTMDMPEYRIPPEALPSVLRVWYLAVDTRQSLTIREAQWVGHLYAAITDTKKLLLCSRWFAATQREAEEAGVKSYRGSPKDDLFLFSIMPGHVVTEEKESLISYLSERVWMDLRNRPEGDAKDDGTCEGTGSPGLGAQHASHTARDKDSDQRPSKARRPGKGTYRGKKSTQGGEQ